MELPGLEAAYGPIHTVIYNAGSGTFKTFDQLSMSEFDRSFKSNVYGLLTIAQVIGTKMAERGQGVIAITGATASLRGKGFTAGFAPAKGAQRMLAQSLARDLGPKGVHVFLAIIDGGVAKVGPDGGNVASNSMDPREIADAYYGIATQGRSAWSFEVDLRPYGEKW
jgi:short-subunit dehydrogenase